MAGEGGRTVFRPVEDDKDVGRAVVHQGDVVIAHHPVSMCAASAGEPAG